MLYQIKKNNQEHIDSVSQMYIKIVQGYFSRNVIKMVKVLPHRVNILFEDNTVSGYDKDDIVKLLKIELHNANYIRNLK